MGILVRWFFAFCLVAATYNPTEYNFVQFATTSAQLSVTVLIGLVLLVGYIIYLRATLRSIGAFGMVLVLALVGALLWVLNDFGLLDLQNQTLTLWLGIFALSFVLGVGLSWSIIRRRLSGQADVDDIDE